jgi:myo-inositol-1(or 4)-monophosphatase
VSVALVKGDEILLGAVALPDLSETYLAEKGEGAFRNGASLPPIPPGPIRPEELVSFSDGFARKHPKAHLPGKMRLAGAFVIDGTFTVSQRYRGLLGHKERLYDIGACVLMGQELGADIRYTDGTPFSIEEITKPEQIGRPWMIFPRDSGFYL